MMARVALAGLFAACSSNPGGVECQCADPSVFIDVPADRAPAVSQVVFSGVACSGASASCVEGDAEACTRYTFRANQAGTCEVDVLFSSGPADFEAQVQFDHIPCCSGLYAPALAGSTIQVPDGAQDAGSAG